MLQKVEVFSSNPSAPELPLGAFMASDDLIQIRSIDGLGPVKAEIASTPFATGDGELYQGSSVGKRNVVMTLGFNPDWVEQTASSLRQKLYAYFMPKAWTKLRFFSDELPTVDIEGIVESFEPNMFSQDPEIQVSVLCHKPDFVEIDATIFTGVVDDGTIELEFDYAGTVNTGFELQIQAAPDNPSYSGEINVLNKNQEPPQIFSVEDVTVDITKYFKLNTVRSQKRVANIAVADGAITNLLAKMTTDSTWPILEPGVNVISVAADEPGQAWTLAYFNRFGGL